MKKNYQNPNVQTVQLDDEGALLAESGNTNNALTSPKQTNTVSTTTAEEYEGAFSAKRYTGSFDE